MEFWGHGGVAHFGISEGKGGLKHGSRPWLGMDIFWNCPLLWIFTNKTTSKVVKKPWRGLLCNSHPVTARLRANFCSNGLEYWLDVRPKNKGNKVRAVSCINKVMCLWTTIFLSMIHYKLLLLIEQDIPWTIQWNMAHWQSSFYKIAIFNDLYSSSALL